MRFGIRGKLFIVTALLVLVADVAVGVYLTSNLRDEREAAIELELLRHARSARAMMEVAEPTTTAAADALADRLGVATGTRITIVAADGEVLGDSRLDPSTIAPFDNHAKRPEILAAEQEGQGIARRYSDTLNTDMLYVAVPWDGGVIRAAMPLRTVGGAVTDFWLIVGFAGLLALGLAVPIAATASQLMSRALRKLVHTAHEMAESDTRPRLPEFSRDELGGLAGSLNKLATNLEQTVATLAHERNQLEAVLHSMGEALISVDERRRITLVNPSAIELLDLPTPTEGRSLVEAIRIPNLHELVNTAWTTQLPSTTELEVPGAVRRRVRAHATPQQSTGGVVVVMHDVTEMRRLETVRRDFVANVSHELRTPVSIIRANAETLLAGALEQPEQAERFLQALLRSADRLGRLISDLLDISRIEAGKYRTELRPVDAAVVAERVLRSAEPKAQAKGTSLVSELETGTWILGDDKALEQVLFNLVDNAIAYTPEGGHVELRSHRESDTTIRLEVVDDGPGIDPLHRPRIFERFYRVDPGRSREMGGTGLGLSIVKHLAEAMEGSVGVEGRSPRGSVFWVRLSPPCNPPPT